MIFWGWWSKNYDAYLRAWTNREGDVRRMLEKYPVQLFNFTINSPDPVLEPGLNIPGSAWYGSFEGRLEQMGVLAREFGGRAVVLRFDPIVFYRLKWRHPLYRAIVQEGKKTHELQVRHPLTGEMFGADVFDNLWALNTVLRAASAVGVERVTIAFLRPDPKVFFSLSFFLSLFGVGDDGTNQQTNKVVKHMGVCEIEPVIPNESQRARIVREIVLPAAARAGVEVRACSDVDYLDVTAAVDVSPAAGGEHARALFEYDKQAQTEANLGIAAVAKAAILGVSEAKKKKEAVAAKPCECDDMDIDVEDLVIADPRAAASSSSSAVTARKGEDVPATGPKLKLCGVTRSECLSKADVMWGIERRARMEEAAARARDLEELAGVAARAAAAAEHAREAWRQRRELSAAVGTGCDVLSAAPAAAAAAAAGSAIAAPAASVTSAGAIARATRMPPPQPIVSPVFDGELVASVVSTLSKNKGQRGNCGCTRAIDVGSYRMPLFFGRAGGAEAPRVSGCPHACAYCYASPAPYPSGKVWATVKMI